MSTAQFHRLPSTVLTIKEAAVALGRHPRVVVYHLEKGNLVGRKVGPIWVIPRAQIDQMIASRHGAASGPKPKKRSIVTPADPS